MQVETGSLSGSCFRSFRLQKSCLCPNVYQNRVCRGARSSLWNRAESSIPDAISRDSTRTVAAGFHVGHRGSAAGRLVTPTNYPERPEALRSREGPGVNAGCYSTGCKDIYIYIGCKYVCIVDRDISMYVAK